MPFPRAYYNENDKRAAAWLRELIREKHIADGDVDDRSIADILPSDLDDYTQCHFFAGIGGWSYALRLAGWPDDKPVWTGSCPCQPFSSAGKGKGFADERHLWPAWLWLARQRRPSTIFGEQVASVMQWIDLVQGDLEAEGYAVGYAVLGAHSVGAPHIRQRLYWVGESNSDGRIAGRIAASSARHRDTIESTGSRKLAESESKQSHRCRDTRQRRRESSDNNDVGNTDDERSQGRSERRDGADQRSAWAAELVSCRDGKRRPVEPGTFPLAHGVPGRVGLLRGYGNAIVPQVAAEFIKAYIG